MGKREPANEHRRQQKALPSVSAQAVQQGLIGDRGIALSQEKQERQRLRREVDRVRLENERLRAAAGAEPEASDLEKTLEQLKLVASNPCNPLRCEVCNIAVSGPKALADHVQGKWHKQAVALAESGGLAPGQVPRPRRFANAKTKPRKSDRKSRSKTATFGPRAIAEMARPAPTGTSRLTTRRRKTRRAWVPSIPRRCCAGLLVTWCNRCWTTTPSPPGLTRTTASLHQVHRRFVDS